MDHIVPMARGGKSTKGNVVPACKVCNNKKKYMLPIEWEEYLQSLAETGSNDINCGAAPKFDNSGKKLP